MAKICLANVDYQQHMTNEGDQFQRGLEAAGWTLVGVGYDGRRKVSEILEHYQPTKVVVHDPRDWAPESPGAFRKDIGFWDAAVLKHAKCPRYVVLKDAGTVRDFQQRFATEIDATGVLAYYEPATVRALNPWLGQRRVIRTYHTLDAYECESIELDRPRKRALVSGALGPVYPLRKRVVAWALSNPGQMDVMPHPGYHNQGSTTPAYLRALSGYKVHVATASSHGFALRKIIESVAMGCTPVTNLPATDPLPEIDGALVRISAEAQMDEVLAAVRHAELSWDFEVRKLWAKRARDWYDWRRMGARLSYALET